MPITIYPGSMKKRNANGSYSDLVPAIATDPEVLDDFAEEYSTSETYNIGDYCIHNSDLYKCNTNNTTGTWNNNAWDRVSVADELVDHKNTLNQVDTDKADEDSLALRRSGATNTGAQIENGTYFYLDGTLKRAISTIATNADFTAQNCETVTAGGLNEIINRMVPFGKQIFLIGQVSFNTKFANFPLPVKPQSISVSAFSVLNVGNYPVQRYTIYDSLVEVELSSAIESEYKYAPARLTCILNY